MKICRLCGCLRSIEEFGHLSRNKDGRDTRCKQCRRDSYLKNREVIKKQARNAYRTNVESRLIKKAEYYEKNRDVILKRRRDSWNDESRKANAEYRNSRRKECYAILGNKCRLCGQSDTRILCIDHVFGDGSIERSSGKSSLKIWNKIITNGHGNKYQLLCFNCNFKKGLSERPSPNILGWVKKCPTCMNYKDAGLFKVDRKYSDGRYYECRVCYSERCATLKRLAFIRIGGAKCICGVDDLDMLTIDHIHGDGNNKRISDGLGSSLYRKIVNSQVDTSRFQVLCFNCNILKYLLYGISKSQ